MAREDNGVHVSLDELYQDIKALRIDVTRLLTKVEQSLEQSKDHETRIRSLERKVWIVSGAAGVAATVIAQLAPIAKILGM